MNIELQDRVTTLEDKPDTGADAVDNIKTENQILFDMKIAPLFLLQSIDQYNKQAIAFNIPHQPPHSQIMTMELSSCPSN